MSRKTLYYTASGYALSDHGPNRAQWISATKLLMGSGPRTTSARKVCKVYKKLFTVQPHVCDWYVCTSAQLLSTVKFWLQWQSVKTALNITINQFFILKLNFLYSDYIHDVNTPIFLTFLFYWSVVRSEGLATTVNCSTVSVCAIVRDDGKQYQWLLSIMRIENHISRQVRRQIKLFN